jgi:hypothetical protein
MTQSENSGDTRPARGFWQLRGNKWEAFWTGWVIATFFCQYNLGIPLLIGVIGIFFYFIKVP